jgi:hypothetical protein
MNYERKCPNVFSPKVRIGCEKLTCTLINITVKNYTIRIKVKTHLIACLLLFATTLFGNNNPNYPKGFSPKTNMRGIRAFYCIKLV